MMKRGSERAFDPLPLAEKLRGENGEGFSALSAVKFLRDVEAHSRRPPLESLGDSAGGAEGHDERGE